MRVLPSSDLFLSLTVTSLQTSSASLVTGRLHGRSDLGWRLLAAVAMPLRLRAAGLARLAEVLLGNTVPAASNCWPALLGLPVLVVVLVVVAVAVVLAALVSAAARGRISHSARGTTSTTSRPP